MKQEYFDTSEDVREKAVNTVLEILRVAKVKVEGKNIEISVLEPAMPAAIKTLYKAGFHRSTSSTYPSGYQPLTLRRRDVIVEVSLPRTMYGKRLPRAVLMPTSNY